MHEIFLKDVITVEGEENPRLIIHMGNGEDNFSLTVNKSSGMTIAEELCGETNTKFLDIHDVLSNIIYKLGASVSRIVLSDLVDNRVLAEIILEIGHETVAIGAKASDAFVVALKTKSRIFIDGVALRKLIGLGPGCHNIKDPNIYTSKISMEGITPGDFIR